MAILYAIVAAAIALAILIVIHEFGHFVVAKKSGVGVLTFSIGFGPKILKRKIGETEYALSAIPFGGYVKMVGEDPDEEVSEADKHRSFTHQPLAKRAAIVAAGPVFNLFLAFFIFACIMIFVGARTLTTEIGSVDPNFPAAAAGIQKGDRMLAVDDRSVESWEEFSHLVRQSGGKALSIKLKRDGQEKTVAVQPVKRETKNIFGESGEAWFIGISPQEAFAKVSPGLALRQAFDQTWQSSVVTLLGLFKMITGNISPKNLGGPLLIAQVAGQQAREGLTNFFFFVAILSVNLGVLNLLPIPVLDGGHLAFFLIEGVLGRRIEDKYRERAQQVGIFVLIMVMIYAFYNDIARFFEG